MGKGNVLPSRGFQFADTETANVYVTDRNDGMPREPGLPSDKTLLWVPTLPKTFQPIKQRYIYAYAFSAPGQKAILWAEYYADEDGALTFWSGDDRRKVEPKAAGKGTKVPEAALPLMVQSDAARYAFVATRGRMGKDAIREMENWLHPIYQRLNLADSARFYPSNNQLFIPVVDILTVAEGMHRAYLVARNAAINYVMVHPFNTDNSNVEVQTLKYRLAKIIRDGLWKPPNAKHDPLDLTDCLGADGQTLLDFMSKYETGLNKLIWAGRNLALDLIRLLRSPLWISACAWYLDKPAAAKEIGHLCLDVFFRMLDRLGETPEGQAFERQLVHDQEAGLLSFLFVPDEDADSDLFDLWFPVVRKAATSVIIGISEMAPALIVYGKARAASMEKIATTIQAFLTHTEVTIVREAARGEFVEMLQASRTSLRIEVNFTEAKADLEGWLEEGKSAWPKNTRMEEVSKWAGRLLMCIEIVNFYNSGSELLKEPSSRHIAELAGALCDLVAALEDPIKGWAATKEAAGAELAGEAGADAEAGGSKIFKALAAPEFYKVLGAFSAAIDIYFNTKDALKAYQHGDQGMAAAKGTIAGGSTFIFAGSVVNAVGYTEAAAAGADVSAAVLGMTAAGSVLLVAGIVIVVVGFVLVTAFSTSPWQKFVRHTCFGDEPAHPGFESWSGGDFSEWTETREGLTKQLQVLTAMLCAFKVSGIFKMSGHGADAESVAITFGAIPPKSKLELKFEIEYEGGTSYKPFYVIDLETRNISYYGGAKSVADFQPFPAEGRLHSLVVSADRPASVGQARIEKSSCSVQIRYAPGTTAGTAATGTIPIKEPVEYLLYDGWEYVEDVSSLDAGGEEE